MAIKTLSGTPGADNSLGFVKDIRAEFGGTPGFEQDGRIRPVQLSQYYRGGLYVPNVIGSTPIAENANIPTSGTIRTSNFYGARTASTAPLYSFLDPLFNTFTGWTQLNQQVHLNGGTTILGWPTPTDPTPNPVGGRGTSPGDVSPFARASSISLTATPFTGATGTAALLNIPNQTISIGGTLLYGPVLYSTNPIYVAGGTILTFQWKAIPGSDAANPYGYMLNPINGATIELLDVTTNSTAEATVTKVFTAGQAGIYHFVFVCGAFDFTFGRAIGARLAIDNVIVDNSVLLS
jgi:hypothetical protein